MQAINTEAAEIYRNEENEVIDYFIIDNIKGGFKGLDRVIVNAIFHGLEHQNNMICRIYADPNGDLANTMIARAQANDGFSDLTSCISL